MSIFFLILAGIGFIVGGVCFLIRYAIKGTIKKGAQTVSDLSGGGLIGKKLSSMVRDVEAPLAPFLFKVLVVELISWGIAAFSGIAALAIFVVDITMISSVGMDYDRESAAGRCNCIAECVYGAGTVDFSKTSYDERGLWANGFYLTHDPYNAAAFMNYALYVQSMGAFKSPATSGAQKVVPNSSIKWSEGTPYECTFFDYMGDDYPIIFAHYSFGNYDSDDCYTVTDSSGAYHTAYINTDFYRKSHENYLRAEYPDMSLVVTRSGEHDYIQGLLDATAVDYYTAYVTPEDWKNYPEISATVGKYFCVTYDYAREHKMADGTETDYNSMVGELASYANWFYDGNASEGMLSELSQNQYYAYAGQTQDKSEDGYVFTPAYSSDSVYREYYDAWVLDYGNSDESLADMIYFIMSDNKNLGSNTNCDVCHEVMAKCTGAPWWMDYTGLFHFVENKRVGFEYEMGDPSNPSSNNAWEDYDGPLGGNNIGEATGEYSCNIPEIMGDKAYYGFAMTAQSRISPNGENMTPHTVVDGVDYKDIPQQLLDKNGTPYGTFAVSCPVFSMAGCISNVIGRPITPLQLCIESGWYKMVDGKPCGWGKGGWWTRAARPGTNSSSASSVVADTEFCDYLRSLDPTITLKWYSDTSDGRAQAFADMCDPTKNTVARISVADPGYSWSDAEWDGTSFKGEEDYAYQWTGEKEYIGNWMHGGHFYYVVDADEASGQILICYNLNTKGYRWVPYNMFRGHSQILIMQTDKRAGSGSRNSRGMSDIDGYPNPTDIETGRIDLSLLEDAGLDMGLRRFEGSWYTHIDGWDSADPASPSRTVSLKGQTFALYDSPPYAYSDYTNAYLLDVGYVGQDMYNWFDSTLDYWGLEHITGVRMQGQKEAVLHPDDGTNSWAVASVATKVARETVPSGCSPVELAAMPFYDCNKAGGQPGTDSYWEKYHDVSGMYDSGGYFNATNNSDFVTYGAYETPFMLILQDTATGEIFYTPGAFNDASGHNFPFASGQSTRQAVTNKVDDICDPDALIPWCWPITDWGRGRNLYQPWASSTDKSAGVWAYDPSHTRNNYSGLNLDDICREYGCPVTYDGGATGYSTVYDYFKWMSEDAAYQDYKAQGINNSSLHIYVQVMKFEGRPSSVALLNGENGYKYMGIILCSRNTEPTGASTGYEYDPSNPNSMADANGGRRIGGGRPTKFDNTLDCSPAFTSDEMAGATREGRVVDDKCGNRELKIYLPYGFDASGSTQYPAVVLRMGDSVDPIGPYKKGFVKEFLDYHIANGDMDPVVFCVVQGSGIWYSKDDDGNGRSNIVDLMAMLEDKYCVSSDPKERIIAGMSRGAEDVEATKQSELELAGLVMLPAGYLDKGNADKMCDANTRPNYLFAAVSGASDGGSKHVTAAMPDLPYSDNTLFLQVVQGDSHDVGPATRYTLRMTAWYFASSGGGRSSGNNSFFE